MTVLLLGRHQELGLYRKEALEAAGMRVLFPQNKRDAERLIGDRNFQAAVISYTLPNDTAMELAELVRQSCPDCPLIAIAEGGWADDAKLAPDEVIMANDGPQALIGAIRRVATRGIRRVK